MKNRRKIEFIFDSSIELFEDLVKSKMYEVVQETTLQIFDNRSIIHCSIDHETDLFMIYRNNDLSMIEVYLGSADKRVFYKIEIKPSFYTWYEIPVQYLVIIEGENGIYDRTIDTYDSLYDASEAVKFANQTFEGSAEDKATANIYKLAAVEQEIVTSIFSGT